jgi:hypothetical protein
VVPSSEALAFYAAPAPMTTLPFDTSAAFLDELPTDPANAAEVTRGVLVHRDWLPFLGLTFDDTRLADQHLRSMRDVIERVLEIETAPLTTERKMPHRMVGVCRHFTTLHVALLRYAGVSARARVGFARYFGDGWVDHWITEWWDGERWVRTDSQVGPVLQGMLGLAFDPADQPAGEFLAAPEAWQRCRAGDEDPARFGIFDLRGLGFVAGSITQDLAALNKVELLPWDIWGELSNGPSAPLADAQLQRADEVVRSIQADDLDELRTLFLEPDVAIPETITTIVDGRPVPATLDRALL